MHRPRKNKIVIITILMLVLSSNLWPQSSNNAAGYPIDGSHLLRKEGRLLHAYEQLHPDIILQRTALRKTTAGPWGFTTGSTHSWYATDMSDPNNNFEYLVSSTCRAVGNNCYIFVEDSSWANGRVNQTVVDSIQHAFDFRTPANPSEGIFQMDTSTFGNPPDVDNDPKIIILILNIRDGYTPGGGYVAGYFYDINEYPTSEVQAVLGAKRFSNDAEIYYLDCNPANLTTPAGFTDACSTTAHEFQHMIHFNYTAFINYNYNVTHSSFINEGCSVLAEVNCGYAIYDQRLYDGETDHYLFDWRTDSINVVSKDYSRAARYFTYMRDQIGIGVFKKIVSSIYDSVTCINDALTRDKSSHRFGDLLPDWFIANILNDTTVNPLYGYRYAGLASVSTTTFSTPYNSANNISIERYASKYYTVSGGNHLNATFATKFPTLCVQAVETGSSGSRVVPVPTNKQFSEPLYGTTYSSINFIVYDSSGTSIDTVSFTMSGDSTATQVAAASSLPLQYGLNQNYPNPFNPSTVIRYSLPVASNVSLKVYDILGHEIATLVSQKIPAGVHSVFFDGSHVASGVYFYRITADRFTETRKFVLLK
ncbi:MAG TPA: T9SS type A sorting domain-containing protein [Bacteroidota bacterium]|nr:T9SS type A sorting domain-containing protein [Bacteroidota bacterium]